MSGYSTTITETVGPTTPVISSLTESPSSGDLDAGKTVTFPHKLSEAVTVAGGTPTLTLNDGGTATYTGGSGSSALTFSYTVGAGQNTAALTATAVNLNAATVTDGAGNAANLSLSGLTESGPQIDTTTPTISSLVESPSSGDLDAGKTVTLTMNLTEAVTVAGGTPTLTLNDGGTATYTSGSGTSALTFSYTVGAGQNTAALTATAVNLNAATIKDAAGNAATLSLSGLTQSGPQIDTTAPTVSSVVASGTGISSGTGDLDAGKTVTLTVNLSEAVTVAGGTPTLTLNDGGTATYTGGSGSSALTFSYTVLAGQNTPDLAVTAVNLNSASITDSASNAANLTGAVTMLPGALQVSTTSTPFISSLTESPSSGDLDAGKTVIYTLNLNEAVTVAGGTPTLALNDGGTATYSGGSGTSALTFSYTVLAGQNTSDLTVTAVNLNSASISDNAGNAANLSLSGIAQGSPQIDTTTPTISSLVESPSSGDLDAGKTVTLTMNLTEAVTVAGGTPTLTLNDGGTATYTGGSGSSALTFSYTVAAGQNTAALTATAVNLNAATVTDGAGNVANLSLSGLTQSGPQIDTTIPAISSLVESPSSGDLDAGKTVTLTLNLSEVVTVAGGTPTLTLNDGGTATYSSGSGSSALTFSYTVGAGQNTAALTATAVSLNAATVNEAAGNDAANLSLSGLTQSGPQIDTTAPTVASVVASGTGISSGTGDLDAGKTVTLTVNLSEAVTVAGGTPTLTLNDGGTATYTGGSGSSALTFSYTVGAGQNTSDLAVTAVSLNSATVTDGAGNAANLTAAVTNPAGILQIDTTTPVISSLTESPSSGDLDAGKTVTFTLNLNEAVTVAGGTPTLTLNDGGTATYPGGSGSSALTFSYTVGAGQNTAALIATAVNLNTATVTDGAGNTASLSLSGLTQSGPQIDTTTPAISSLVESPSSGDLDAGKTVTFTLNLSEAVTVAGGTPTLTLNDGGTATYTSGSGSSALTFSYTVGAGQNTAALTATAVNLNTATVTDGAGNVANLSLSGLTQSGPQIDTTTPAISSLVESPSSGDLDAGKTVTLTLNLSEVVTVAGGTPTLTLNDGGTATYTGGSGSSALTFSYTVGAGQNTAALTATAVSLNAATIKDAAGNAAILSLSGLTQSGPQIDTTAPTVSSVVASGTGISSGTGDLDAGKTVTLTVNLSEAVTVAGGTPTLSLNDGGTATYTGGSGSSALTFSYTVGAGQNTSDLAVTAVSLNSATVTDGAGNAANLTAAVTNPAGILQIDTTTPVISSLTESPASTELNAGKTVTFTLNLNEAVTVAGGTPTLTLNDGGTATYTGGSGSSALTFSYTVGAGQNTAALIATAVNLNTATVTDGAGNVANLSLSGLTQSGPQIDTTTPAISSLVESPSSGDLDAGKTVTFTLNLSEAVTVAGGTPTLTLNDGGTATYTGGSGSSALTFSYTVGAGQNTAALTATAVNLNAATVTDGAGNVANLSLSGITQSGPQIDTTTPAAPVITNDLVNGNNTVTLSGTAQANSTIEVFAQTTTSISSKHSQGYQGTGAVSTELTPLGTATANGSGAWSYTTGAMVSGTQSYTATDTDAAGNVSGYSTTITVTVAPPAAPTVASDTINGNSVTLIGTAEANSTVTVYDQQGSSAALNQLGTAQASSSGSWTYSTAALQTGTYVFYATATDANGTSAMSAGLDPVIGEGTAASATATTQAVIGTLEVSQPSAANFAFQAGIPGELVFEQPSTFTGTVAGMGTQGSIDRPGIAFGPQTTLGYLPNSNQAQGTLSVTNGNQNASIALLGNYIASSFAAVGDGHGGTMVVAETSQSGTQPLLANPQHT